MTSYQLYIFDFDGTLSDSLPWFRTAFNEIAVRHGFRQMSPQELESLRNIGPREALKAASLPLWKLPFLMRDVRKRMAETSDSIPLFSGVGELFTSLSSQGKSIAIVSSNSESTIRTALGPDISHMVSQYQCGAGFLTKARQLKKVLRRFKIPNESVLYIGDEVRDAEAAKGVGISFGAVSWGYGTVAALSRQTPSHHFESLDQIGGV